MTEDSTREELLVFEDGDFVLLCDPENPHAWIRSSHVVSIDEFADNNQTRRP